MAKTGNKASTASAEPNAAQRRGFATALLAWYDRAARDLPWRKVRDPYAIWVSEVMLQQTQVATVVPYYERWMRRFPSVSALAQAADDDALRIWQGLGYYSRARGLVRGARAVVDRFGGRLPEDVDTLRSLPGIGPYTAGAIASIAFERRAAVVDGNVIRVLCRSFGLAGDPRRAPLEKTLWALAEQLVPQRRPGDFNQALMELGATVCTPKTPRCEACPLRRRCRALATGRVDQLPALAKRRATTAVRMVAGVLERRGRVLLVQLPPDAPRWAGLWQFPCVELDPGESSEAAVRRALLTAAGATVTPGKRLLTLKHGVTRFRITLEAYACQASSAPRLSARAAWKRPQQLSELALPAAHARIARSLMAQNRRA